MAEPKDDLERERNILARQVHEAFTQSPRSMVIYDVTGKPLAVNNAFERLWGVSLADVPPTYSVLSDPQLEAAGILPHLRKAFGLEGPPSTVLLPPVQYEMSDTTGRGETLWTQAHAYPVLDSAGNVERVVLTHEDITQRRAAEAARERASALQALTAALSQASTIAEIATVMVNHTPAVLSARDVIVVSLSADGTMLELLAASGMPDDVRAEWTAFPVDAEVPLAEVARTREPLYLESRDQSVERYSHLAGMFEATGHHANVVLPLVSNDVLLGVLGAAFDAPQAFDEDYRVAALTLAQLCAQALDRARLFEAERRSREVAEQANRAKSEFLAIMSHELRTPLNAIGGYAEIIEMGIRGPVTEEQRIDLQRIQKSQRHLLGLVNGVLNYSRVEAGTVSYDIKDVVLREVLRTCEALVAPQLRERGLTFESDLPPDDVLVRADEEKLQQVVLNLLANAIKFTDRGGEVRLEGSRGTDGVIITVSDTGCGIPPDQLHRIFEPFVQVNAGFTRVHEGVGLGLAISRDLARGMGGDLTAASVEGKGSTFTVTLPLPGK